MEKVISKKIAWRNVLLATIAAWVILAIPNFAFLTHYLAETMGGDLLLASLYLDIGFVVSSLILIALVVWWQRRHGEVLADLGVKRPTPKKVMVISIIFGAVWASSFYFTPGHLNFLDFPWERFIMAPLGIILAFAEELLFRGFIMEQLRRAGVSTWKQVIVSAVTIASYHGLVGFHYYPVYAISSFVLFGVLALLHVWGRRSMLPNTTAHSMSHIFGDPSAIMGILIAATKSLK